MTKQGTDRKSVIVMAIIACIGIFAVVFGVLNNRTFDVEYPAQKWVYYIGLTLLLVIMLCKALQELFRPATSIPKKPKKWFYPLISGVLTLGIMALAYTYVGMWPLGEKSAMMVDMYWQYAPLLFKLRDMFLHGGNVFYSFNLGLGNGFLPTFAYYLSSPFNLLLVLFPENLLTEAILVITLLKNALSAVTFAMCIQYIYGRKNIAVPTVSVLYATMMYVLAYSWNIMWLDALTVLPLTVLGLEYLMRTGRFLPYVLSLAYLIFTNYYIGFMICVFLVLYFIAFILRHPKNTFNLCNGIFRFLCGSAVAGGLTAALILPTFFALLHTSAASETLFKTVELNFSFLDIFSQHLYGSNPTIRSGNLPNVACGMLTVIALPLFATLKCIPVRRRVTYIGLWAVMLLSMFINQLDLLWHGLHIPNDLPYRYSFLYCFVMLLMAYEVLLHLCELSLRSIVLTVVGFVVFLLLTQIFKRQNISALPILISFLLVCVYGMILAMSASKILRVRTVYCFLLLVVTAEVVMGAENTFVKLDEQEGYTDHFSYVDNDYTVAAHSAVEKTKNIADAHAKKDSSGIFYRMEMLPRHTMVDTAMYGYPGITLFSSDNYYTTSYMMRSLGFESNGTNIYSYMSFVPSVDSLFGIRYLVMDTDCAEYDRLKKLDSVEYGKGKYYIFENKDALPLAYMVPESLKKWKLNYYNPVVTQNSLYKSLTGDSRKILQMQKVTADVDCAIVSAADTSASSFTISPDGEDKTATFTADIGQDGQYFFYVDCTKADSIDIENANGTWSMSPIIPYMINGGRMKTGETVTVSITAEEKVKANIYVCALNEEFYYNTVTALAKGGMKVTSFSDTHITGTVEAAENGILMTTVPYDNGWTVKVDGKKVETFGVANAMLAVNMSSGKHTVEMSFCPTWFWLGVCISVLSLVTLIFEAIGSHRREVFSVTGGELLCTTEDPNSCERIDSSQEKN